MTPDAQLTHHPIISAKDLTPSLFGEMMRRRGCLLVRGLIGLSDVLKMRAIAAQTYEIYDRAYQETEAGGAPFEDLYVAPDAYGESRKLMKGFRDFGSLILSSCPLAAASLVPILSGSRMRPCVEAYFDAPIGLSANASSLRFSERGSTIPRVFHQDGNFLGGEDAETINCWIALDPCGVDAPSMEVFPQRVDRLLPAGGPNAMVSWEIAEMTVYGTLGAENAWVPEFLPGDAFLFNHTHVHRTHATPSMTKDRFALECWMFP
ncbi:MAG: hypothetical protein ACOVVK_20290, partial [Elsteraceae bacterium]